MSDDNRKSGRMQVKSFPLAHDMNEHFVKAVCEKYNETRRESKLACYLNNRMWEVRLEMTPGRPHAFTMDEVNWAHGFVAGFKSNWRA